MHLRSVLHLEGYLLTFCAAFMLTTLPWAFYYGEDVWPALLLSSGITAAAGFLMLRFTRLTHELRIRDGFAIVSFAWLLISLFGTLPYLLTGSIPQVTDAYFEAVSGFTTTGATILADIESLPRSVLFWRSLTHWMGGMGIIVLSLAVLPMLGVGGMQLYKAEVSGPTADKLTPRIAETAKVLWVVYAALTLLQTVLLLGGGMSLFDALCTSFGSISSGGFSPRNLGIASYNSSYVDWVVTFFMITAGTNYALHYRFVTGNWRAYWQDREFHVFMASMATAIVLVLFYVWSIYADPYTAVRDAVFTVVATQTGTGFTLVQYENWSYGAQFLLLILMLIGGSAGSTSGGLKVVRVYLLYKYLIGEFTRLLHPQAVVPVRIKGVSVRRDVMADVLGFVGIYFLTVILGTFLVTSTGADWVTSLSAVVSAVGAVGPGMGEVGPYDNYAWLAPFAKWVLTACMLLGRLEFFSLLILFSPAYWRR